VSFKAHLKLHWNSHLDLKSFGSQWSSLYGEKKKLKNLHFFSTEERKTWTSWMTWGWVNYQQKFFKKWTTPLIRFLKLHGHFHDECTHVVPNLHYDCLWEIESVLLQKQSLYALIELKMGILLNLFHSRHTVI